MLKIGLKFFLTKNNKISSCKKPAKETAYDKVKTFDMLSHCEKNSDPIKITFNTIGAAAATANLLYELRMAAKNEAKQTKIKKEKLFYLNQLQALIF